MKALLLILLTAAIATAADYLPGTWQYTSPEGDVVVLELSEGGDCRMGFVADLDEEPLQITLKGTWEQAGTDSLALVFAPEKTLLNGMDLETFVDQMLEGVDLPPEEVTRSGRKSSVASSSAWASGPGSSPFSSTGTGSFSPIPRERQGFSLASVERCVPRVGDR